MTPQDFLKINIFSIGLILFYATVLIFMLFWLLSGFRILTYKSAAILLLGYVTFLAFGLLNSIFQFIQIPPDTVVYGAIIIDPPKFVMYSLGVKTYATINFFPFLLCLRYPIVFVTFSIFYYFLGMLLIWRGYSRLILYAGKRVSPTFLYLYMILAMAYPMAIITIPTLLRESLMVLSLGISFNLFTMIFCKIKLGLIRNILLVIALLILLGVRPVMGICFVLSAWLSVSFFGKGKKVNMGKVLRLLVAGSLLLVCLMFVVQKLYTITFSLQWLNLFRNSYIPIHGDEGYGYNMDWENPIHIVINFVILFMQYLLSPVPFLFPAAVSFRKFLAWVDVFFIVILLLIIFFKKDLPYKKMLLFFIFINLVIPSVFETHVTGAFRHRMNGIVLLMPMAAYALSRFFIKSKTEP
ncbi:hypothetical protein DCC81_01165 [Chitinophaga parva]|uniref:Glycosyltransferase RgtA/B/C/D-like domain-containing protein n=2 Tax=Chitinophaga parva TaxID=2169414 RepID=A0A2T7BKD2_9BACT|nr:hypothetical protein DCC81_01165 [Chitinophaga parva]